jgi:hypothetical protein
MILGIFLLVLQLAVCSFGPGLLIVRYFRWRPMETVCAAIALSHLILYLTVFLGYLLNPPVNIAYFISAAALGALLVCRRDLGRLWSNRRVKQMLCLTAALFVWILLALGIIRHYSGGQWFGDWCEHYDRARFFLDRQPAETRFLGSYSFTARPPWMNLLAAYFLSASDNGFVFYQVICAFFNALVLVPCCLLLPALFARGRRAMPILLVLLACNPFFVQNATWTWTRLYCALYVLFGLAFYLAAWRKGSMGRMIAAFGCLACAMLIHYSTGPFLVFLALHYLLVLSPSRERRWTELAAITTTGSAILATWFGWAIAVYGVRGTFGSNTTVEGFAAESLLNNLEKIAYNLLATLIPFPVRGLPIVPAPDRTDGWVTLRDFFFHLYQTNLLFAFGSVGWLALSVLLFRAFRSAATAVSAVGADHNLGHGWHSRGTHTDDISLAMRRFWIGLIITCFVLGIAAHGTKDDYGLVQICLVPMVLLGIIFLAARFGTLPPPLRLALIAGVMLDFVLGIWLQVHIQALDPNPGQGTFVLANLAIKQDHDLVFLGDCLMPWAVILQVLLVGLFLAGIAYLGRRALRCPAFREESWIQRGLGMERVNQ